MHIPPPTEAIRAAGDPIGKRGAGAAPGARRGPSPLSALALTAVALVLAEPLWPWLLRAVCAAAWLACSLVAWEVAKSLVLPARTAALAQPAQIVLMLCTFVPLRWLAGWSAPLPTLPAWYFFAVLVPALDTFIGLETVSGIVRFAMAPKAPLFPYTAL